MRKIKEKAALFVTKHCGEIGFIIAGISLVVMVAFLVAGNGAAAGISLCAGMFIGAPLRIAYELGSKSSPKERTTKKE